MIGALFVLLATLNFYSFDPEEEIAYLSDDVEVVELRDLFCRDPFSAEVQLVDLAIISALAYGPPEESKERQIFEKLRASLPSEWTKTTLPQAIREEKFGKDNLTGLHLDYWHNSKLGTVVVSFRGTDGFLDWHANLNWLTKHLWFDTQYEKVHAAIPDLVRFADERFERPAKIHSVGHSLGGGLAQHALYSSPRISEAYVFNSTPVTGWFDIDEDLREASSEGAKVVRMHRHNDVLEAVRPIVRFEYLFSTKRNSNPHFVEYRTFFQKTEDNESAIDQHEMLGYANQILDMSQECLQAN